MTAPTPKPDGPDEKATPRRFRIPRPAALAISAGIAFVFFAVVLIRVLPSPHAQADYLIVGTLATLAALITIFTGLVMGRRKR
jgi:multisubunit Na+/H+ antiporter MnhF subunit